VRLRPLALPALLSSLAACGWDSLLLTPRSFTPTEPPTVILTGKAEALSSIRVLSKGGEPIAETEVSDNGDFTVRLPPKAEGTSLRLLAQKGAYTAKTIVARAPVGETTDVGAIDARSTAIAQLTAYEVIQQAGSSFAATPPPALAGLIAAMNDQPTTELAAFIEIVSALLLGAKTADGEVGPFDIEGFALSEGYARAAMLAPDVVQRYKSGLAAAAQGYSLQIRCDPSRLNVMFTVDVSGRGLDGNGVPQLIRQPTKSGHVFLGFTSDETSPIADPAIPPKLTPNDSKYTMTDDGKNGDEVSADGIYTIVVPLPRGARLLYKYTNGAAGEGFTGAEEWPGNARIIQVEDVLTGRPDDEPDCLVIRRDSFGDESTNKNFVNLNAKAKERGGTVTFDTDLGGIDAPEGKGGIRVGGLSVAAARMSPGLTPKGVPEARENGVCTVCPAPLVLDPDDMTPPQLVRADRLSIDHVRITFSEPLDPNDAKSADHFEYLDATGRSAEIRSASPQGADVILVVAPTDPRQPAKVSVKNVRDASARGNALDSAMVDVGPDTTPPKVLSVRALSLLDVQKDAEVADPTVGDLVEVAFDERPEQSAAEDPSRFSIDGLEVLAAMLVADEESAPPALPSYRIRLATETQVKGLAYAIKVSGVRDPAGNALDQETTFDAFALYRVTFGVVPGFAFSDPSGQMRGLPRGEKLYLTGTPIGAARGLDGRDISSTSMGQTRTDVTGWPQFEMKPSPDTYMGSPIYRVSMLLPKGAWAWKAAHGIEGEWMQPPTTLEKVYKTLATTADGTGVRIDPATLEAANGLSYAGAKLSSTGDEPPRANVVFKREAPDELCTVNQDIDCPFIVVGTWRDLVLDQNGRTQDYDDGIVVLPPHHPSLPDYQPPKLLDARARDSFSILLSFDKKLASPAATLQASVERADNHFGVPVGVLPTTDVKPHQAVIRINASGCEEAMAIGTAYTVRYRGALDEANHADDQWRTQTLLAPDSCVAFTPLVDRSPPAIASVIATDLTEITVRFSKRLDPGTAALAGAYAVTADSGAALQIMSAFVQPDKQTVVLTTGVQQILQPYKLTVTGIADASDPANVLAAATFPFVGFGDRVPPNVIRARAISPTQVLVRFDEAIEPITAVDASKYAINGLTIMNAAFSGDPARRIDAFNAVLAPKIRDTVLLTTSPMTDGMQYTLEVTGVHDLSGNSAMASLPFTGVSTPPAIDVVIEYVISDSTKVAGMVPSRAISVAELAQSREGVFILGARSAPDNSPVPGMDPPVNDALGGFGVEGQPTAGLAKPLKDSGVPPDLSGGDGVYAIKIPAVPLGTAIIWKAFASYSVQYHQMRPDDPNAAFADALPGPSVFGDGQEYPGNENGALILDDGSSDGVVRIRCLFGDEITYKKHTMGPAYVWIADDFRTR
jgi:Big-like domain-containing protein